MFKKSAFGIVFAALLMIMMGVSAVFAADAILNPAHVGATHEGFQQGSCPIPPAGQETWYGWHFVMPGSDQNFGSLSVTFASAGTFSADPFPGTTFIAHPDNSHAYIWTPTADTLLGGTATSVDGDGNPGTQDRFNLSHVCAPYVDDYEELTVSKTADTSFIRTHDWSIEKSVDRDDVYLYVNGSGDATVEWTVDVAYEGYVDSAHNVSGDITIENTGTLDANINSVDDVLAGNAISVDCGVVFPYELLVGETLICTYSEDGNVEGFNEASVTTDVDTYEAEPVEIVWGDPDTEINATAAVKDISDLFGDVDLGTVTAPDGDSFSYTHEFAWADYGQNGCGDFTYNNTAQVIGDGDVVLDEDSESVNVHVQCLECETAWAANGNTPGSLRYTTRGNWATYVKLYGATSPKTVSIFAGQTNYVGTATFTWNGNVAIAINLNPDVYLNANTSEAVKIQGYNAAPSGNPAPGLFTTYKGGLPVPTVGYFKYFGVHLDVCLPDPDFGPSESLSVLGAAVLPPTVWTIER